jgi:DNA polymerase elongation subunit (family B)
MKTENFTRAVKIMREIEMLKEHIQKFKSIFSGVLMVGVCNPNPTKLVERCLPISPKEFYEQYVRNVERELAMLEREFEFL